MSVQIRLLLPGEEHLANNFFNKIYDTDRSIDAFRWEFVEGAFGRAIYVIAVDDTDPGQEKVVGIQCAIPIEMLHTSGKTVITAKSEDTLVDPGYRGQKIFERMYDLLFEECRKNDIEYIWGFTPAEKAFSRLGFEIPFKAKQALTVWDVGAAYRHLVKLNPKNTTSQKIKILGLCIAARMKRLVSAGQPKGYTVRKGSFNEINYAFFQVYSNRDLFSLNFTSGFSKWRLIDNPNQNNYEVLIVERDQKKVGMVLINARQDVSYIELIILEEEHVAPALRKATQYLRKTHKAGLTRVLTFNNNNTNSQQEKLMEKEGFVVLDRGSFFVWKKLTDNPTVDPALLFLNRTFTQGNL